MMSASDDKNNPTSNTSDEPRVISAPARADGQDKKAEPESSEKKRAKPAGKAGMTRFEALLLVLALLVSGASAAGVAWLYQQQYLQPAEPDPILQSLRRELDDQSGKVRALSASQDGQLEKFTGLRSELQQSVSTLNLQQQSLVEAITALSTVDRSNWLLAEAEYLLRLANQRAQLNRDADGAAKLLVSADEILRSLDDPALHSARTALADEIAALKSTADFDLEGVYLKLEGLISLCSELRLFEAPKYQPETTNDSADTWQDRLQSGLDKAWAKLRSYIRVRHHDANFQAVLAPEQEAVLRASLRLMLEQAQLALLAERPALYQRSLEKARGALERYYLLDEGRSTAIDEIDALLTQPVARDIADISTSLRELKRYVDSRRWQREAGR